MLPLHVALLMCSPEVLGYYKSLHGCSIVWGGLLCFIIKADEFWRMRMCWRTPYQCSVRGVLFACLMGRKRRQFLSLEYTVWKTCLLRHSTIDCIYASTFSILVNFTSFFLQGSGRVVGRLFI